MSRSLRSDLFARAARPKVVQPHRRRLRIEPLEDRRLLAAVIGIDFGGPGEVIAANQTAGAIPRTNWNVASGGTSAVNNLVNDANVATTADVSWSSDNTWRVSNSLPADGNAAIYKGYLDTSAVSTTTVTVVQVPFALYDVYVYFDGDVALGRSGKYTIDTSTLAPITQGEYLDSANWPIAAGGGVFALADAPGEAGNYALFTNLSGESFALTATPFGGANPRAPVNAIQIVERPLQVDTNTDIVDGNYGAGQFSLREAIALANARPGADTITFAAGMSGQTILLGGSQLTITDAVTIDAAQLAQNVTINAQQQSRIFDLTTTSGDVTLAGLTLNGGRTTGNFDNGGAIRSTSSGLLTLNESTVSGNSSTGSDSWGGGIQTFGSVTLTHSTVSGNSTAGDFSHGGGIHANGSVTLTQSTVSGNSTAGDNAWGGGIFASGSVTLTHSTVSGNSSTGSGSWGGGIQTFGSVTLTHSTVSGNSTAGDFSHGGGIHAIGSVTLTQSTVSGNSSSGNFANGGGIFANNSVTLTQSTVSGNTSGNTSGGDGGGIRADYVTLIQSTVSGNSSGGGGGGIFARIAATFTQSTITNNQSVGAGGGLYQVDYLNAPVTISGSIIAGNTATGGSPDLRPDPDSVLTVNYSLIGVASGLIFTGNVGNLTGTTASPLNPQLGPLADNGGPTKTHALLPGSPAIDAGRFTGPFAVLVAIPGLFNTGVNAAGSLLADNVNDPHYQLIVQPGSGLTDRAVAPDPAWVAANSTSRWISVAADRLGPVGDYTYRTTFDLTSFNPATATLSGMLASDNTGMGITLNGGTTLNVASNFGDFLPFTFNVGASFVAGINTLDFKLNNGGEAANPTGLRVDGLTGTVNWLVDQRGTGFARVVDGDTFPSARIDIGAYESQGVPGWPVGDYTHNGIANAADYVLWRDNFTAFGGNPTGYNTWRQNFGNTTIPVTPPGSGAGSEFSSAESSGATGSASAESAPTPSDFAPTTFTPSSSRQSSSVALNQTPNTPNDKRMLLAFDQALEELDEERNDSRWLADSDDAEEETESEHALAAALCDW